jgi:hypothetical protein
LGAAAVSHLYNGAAPSPLTSTFENIGKFTA